MKIYKRYALEKFFVFVLLLLGIALVGSACVLASTLPQQLIKQATYVSMNSCVTNLSFKQQLIMSFLPLAFLALGLCILLWNTFDWRTHPYVHDTSRDPDEQ